MQLMPGVALVASGWLGCSLSDRHDCHVYLVAGDDDAFLVDAGCGLDIHTILGRIDLAGVARERITRVLLTHGHADHAAGAAALADALGAEIWASPETADIVETADHQASGLDDAIADGTYPSSVRFVPQPVQRRLGDERFVAAGMSVAAVPTPGHAAGHLCFLVETSGRRVLFSGDLVFARGRVAILDTPDTDVAAMRSSIECVAAMQPDALFAGHGEHVIDGALGHLGHALSAFDSGALPPSFLA